MIVSVGNTKTQDHLVQKRRIRQLDAGLSKVFAGEKPQLVHPRGQIASRERIARPAVLIGYGFREKMLITVYNTMQLDRDAFSGSAMDGVKHVRR
jgi:hypothetical protein